MIQELVMLAKDAGASEFICPLFTVRFPPPAPVVVEKVVHVVPLGQQGVIGDPKDTPRTNYDALFPGGKPSLRKVAE